MKLNMRSALAHCAAKGHAIQRSTIYAATSYGALPRTTAQDGTLVFDSDALDCWLAARKTSTRGAKPGRKSGRKAALPVQVNHPIAALFSGPAGPSTGGAL